MKNLINREDYIKEYLRINRNVENGNELYESLLSTVFGGLNMLFKRDWANIKCKNQSVLTYLKEIDKTLTGYTMVKMEFSNECKTIRQNIADYFNDILDYKLKQLEKEEDPNKFLNSLNDENKDAKGVAKKLNLADKILLDTLDKYKSNIKIACKQSPKLREYADQMLNCVEIFINSVILDELEKKGADKEKVNDKKKKLEEQSKQQEKERQENNNEAKKETEEAVKKLSKERDAAITALEANLIPNNTGGVKTAEKIANEFSKMIDVINQLNESALPKSYIDSFNKTKGASYIGIQKSLEEINWNFTGDKKETSGEGVLDKFFIKVILNKINTTFEVVMNNKDFFKGVPAASVQAMMIALSNAIIYGFVGESFKIENNEARLSLLTKCAIDSDATIGFNLPPLDDKKPEDGNFFVGIMNKFKSEDISQKEIEKIIDTISEEECKTLLDEWNAKNNKEEEESENKSSDSIKIHLDTKEKFIKDFGYEIMKDFKNNMTKLFDSIVKKAEILKKEAQKKRDDEAAKAQQESESNENE